MVHFSSQILARCRYLCLVGFHACSYASWFVRAAPGAVGPLHEDERRAASQAERAADSAEGRCGEEDRHGGRPEGEMQSDRKPPSAAGQNQQQHTCMHVKFSCDWVSAYFQMTFSVVWMNPVTPSSPISPVQVKQLPSLQQSRAWTKRIPTCHVSPRRRFATSFSRGTSSKPTCSWCRRSWATIRGGSALGVFCYLCHNDVLKCDTCFTWFFLQGDPEWGAVPRLPPGSCPLRHQEEAKAHQGQDAGHFCERVREQVCLTDATHSHIQKQCGSVETRAGEITVLVTVRFLPVTRSRQK